jgi:hypothetical protein
MTVIFHRFLRALMAVSAILVIVDFVTSIWVIDSARLRPLTSWASCIRSL